MPFKGLTDNNEGQELTGFSALKNNIGTSLIDEAVIKPAQSTFYGTTELFGFEPPRDVELWRQRHPILGLTTEFASVAVPYAGYASLASKAPRFTKAVQALGNIEKAPVLTRGLQAAATFAPFEAARVGVAAMFGDKPVEDTIADAAISLGLEGGFGAGFEVLRQAGKRSKHLEEVVGDVDLGQSNQDLYTQIKNLANQSQDAAESARLHDVARKLSVEILSESPERAATQLSKTGVPAKGTRYVGRMDGKLDNYTDFTNNLFEKGSVMDQGEWNQFILDNHLPSGFEAHVQFPRQVQVRPKSQQANELELSFTHVGEGTYINRESSTGLYVVAKKWNKELPDGKIAEDVYTFFKTDSPEALHPLAGQWTKRFENANRWAFTPGERPANAVVPIFDEANAILNEREIANYFAQGKASEGKAGLLRRLSEATGLDDNALVARFGEALDKYINPRLFQLTDRPLARTILHSMESAFDAGDQIAKRFLYGEFKVAPQRRALQRVSFGTLEGTGEGIESLSQKLTDQDWERFSDIIVGRWGMNTVEQAANRGEVSENVLNLMRKLNATDKVINKMEIDTRAIAGKAKWTPRDSHFLVPHVWEGDHRVFIKNDKGELVHVAAGNTPRAAKTRANQFLQAAREEGKIWEASDVVVAGTPAEMDLLPRGMSGSQAQGSEDALLSSRIYRKVISTPVTPYTHRQRREVGGFVQAFNHDKFMRIVGEHVNQRMKHVASLSARTVSINHLQKIAAFGDSHAIGVIAKRLEQMEGVSGPVARAINEAADKVLTPVLGKNSATKIVSTANKTFMHLALGAGNLSYSAMSALTFMQTVVPHVAYVARAPRHEVAKLYQWLPMADEFGKARRAVGVLSPIKLQFTALRDMHNPSKELSKALSHAVNDGTIDPRLIEDYIGQSASTLRNIKETLKTPGQYPKFLTQLSEFGMAAPERFSRMHAFTVGHKMFRELMGLPEEQAYKLAKQFTDNTMFRYAAADRPVLFAGPAGSTFGLFKNWAMHYLHSMVMYSKEASKGNFAPLLWQMAGTGIVGGVGAMPFYSIADSFNKFANNQSLMQSVYDTFNLSGDDTTISDAVYMGLPSLLGMSLSMQTTSPLNDPLVDITQMFGMVQMNRMRAMGKAVGGWMDYAAATGDYNGLKAPIVRDNLARAVAPKTMYRVMQVVEEDAIRELGTGNPLVKNVSPVQKLLYSIGLTPTDVQRTYQVAKELREDKEQRKRMTSAYGQQWAEAQLAGDTDAMDHLLRRAIGDGLDLSTIMKSATRRIRQRGEDLLHREYKEEDIYRFQQVLGGNQ